MRKVLEEMGQNRKCLSCHFKSVITHYYYLTFYPILVDSERECHPSDLDSTQGDRGLTILGDIEPVLVQSVCNKCVIVVPQCWLGRGLSEKQ